MKVQNLVGDTCHLTIPVLIPEKFGMDLAALYPVIDKKTIFVDDMI